VGYGLDHHSHAYVSVCCCCGDCQTSGQNRDVQPAELCRGRGGMAVAEHAGRRATERGR
jgi:hypothetical protein